MFFLLRWLENLYKPESPGDLKKRLRKRVEEKNSRSKKASERDG